MTIKHKFLADLTWEEVSIYLGEKNSLIIPIGMCEQHGTHLPLNTDTLCTEYIAKYLSQTTAILIAPTFPYGIGLPCDKFFAGTSNIEYEDLNHTISSLLSWWKLQGFQKFFIISAHGDPIHLRALKEIKQDGVFVLEVFDINLEGILEKQQTAQHAGEAETSVMLYLFPEKVRTTKIEDFETHYEEFRDYLYHVKQDPIPDSPGCQGYPSYATKEKGEQIVRLMKDHALKWINRNM